MSWLDALGLFRLTYTKDPQEAASLGYVNAGTDRRIAGELGRLLGSLQTQLSYKSTTLPERKVEEVGNVKVAYDTDPGTGKQHVSVAVPRPDGRWATIRFGWRYDPYWGDANVVGFNPQPEIVGGYIFDVVIKLNATRSFID